MGRFLSVIERLEALKEGKSIKKINWSKDLMVVLEGKHLRYDHNSHKVGERVAEDILDCDCKWEIVGFDRLDIEDVGKKIKYSDGSMGMVLGYIKDNTLVSSEITFTTDKGKYNIYGSCISDDRPDIIKIFDE